MNSQSGHVKLGLKENLHQFSLLVLINAFVGAMVGMERSVLPEIAQKEFHLATMSSALSFIAAFGLSKASANYIAGRISEKHGRKYVLVLGWLIALPVAPALAWAPSWNWILIANVLLGVSQGFTWSTTVIMKIDLVGPQRRGLAMGLNEFAGYLAVALSAFAAGFLASRFGLRPAPFYLGFFYAIAGTLLSALFVRETLGHRELEASMRSHPAHSEISHREIFLRTTLKDRELSSITQAGFVNNLNDGMVWGLLPLLYSSLGMDLAEVGTLAGVYPAVWGILQIWTGHLSDRLGRKGLISGGMLVQAIAIGLLACSQDFLIFFLANALLGVGTAMVYPTLLAAIGDHANPAWRASSVGVYRLWRDSGYAFGALFSGWVADRLGFRPAIGLVGIITAFSGVWVALRMRETLKAR